MLFRVLTSGRSAQHVGHGELEGALEGGRQRLDVVCKTKASVSQRKVRSGTKHERTQGMCDLDVLVTEVLDDVGERRGERGGGALGRHIEERHSDRIEESRLESLGELRFELEDALLLALTVLLGRARDDEREVPERAATLQTTK